jgi:hypothetical protein
MPQLCTEKLHHGTDERCAVLCLSHHPPAAPPTLADIQGTAGTALAGLYGALRVTGQPLSAISQQRVLCVGAGSAGMGVVSMIAKGGYLRLAPLVTAAGVAGNARPRKEIPEATLAAVQHLQRGATGAAPDLTAPTPASTSCHGVSSHVPHFSCCCMPFTRRHAEAWRKR